MATDDFSIPLGQHRMPRQRAFRLAGLPIATGVLVAIAAAIAAAWMMMASNPLQEPPTSAAAAPASAVTPARGPAQIGGNAALPPLPKEVAVETPPASAPAGRTITIIDGTTGKRREIMIPGTTDLVGFDQPAPEPPPAQRPAPGPSSRLPAQSMPAR
ncbi:MAG TPA: hypothetical protein VGH39_11895 [Xanthobacteraceae bacterium]|jgi:hypothetical protein